MIRAEGERVYQFKAVTDIWTGNIYSKENSLITTGLLGSIRWWFEVLVRGLGGYACDPSRTDCQDQNHCIVCELFGCTGWARKFRFQVLDEHGHSQTEQIKAGTSFQFSFTPLRSIQPVEWSLLDATLRLIAQYGAIGGKTVYKPSDEPGRTSVVQHRDYGLISICNDNICICSYDELRAYLHDSRWRKIDHGKFACTWASLDHFWDVEGKYLARQSRAFSTFNRIVGRPEPKDQSSMGDSWLSGYRSNPQRQIEAESKKIYSFKKQPRTFGFVQQLNEHDSMRKKLVSVWGGNGWTYLSGDQIRGQLFDINEDKK